MIQSAQFIWNDFTSDLFTHLNVTKKLHKAALISPFFRIILILTSEFVLWCMDIKDVVGQWLMLQKHS